jgi:GNAT superfamily N-acetyltransferase
MNIRPAVPSDLDALDALYTERQTIVAQSTPKLSPFPHGTPAWLDRPNGIVLVGGTPAAGYVSLWHTRWLEAHPLPANTALLDHMALDAHAYHPGLGRALAEAARAWAAHHQQAQLWVLVPRYDPISQAFWRAVGASPLDAAPAPLSLTGYQLMQKRIL